MLRATFEVSMPDTGSVSVRTTRSRARADEWALVLAAEGLHPRITRGPGGFALQVGDEEAERAFAALAAYAYENPNAPPTREAPGRPMDLTAGLVISCALLVFFSVTGPRDPRVPWFARGSADAERILDGEVWRTVTALTLHADMGHALGNALAGTLFVGAVCSSLGVGAGGALVLVAGAAGNAANALLRGPNHRSVGASTAIFGAVGILGALGVRRHRLRGVRGRRALAPAAAGLALLAMLGTGDRADLSAHLLGLLAGALLGAGVAPAPEARAGRTGQALLAAAAIAALLGCWSAALR
jgi:membrane associated rhomboid family serine protease